MKSCYGVKFTIRVISLVVMVVFIGYTGLKTTSAAEPVSPAKEKDKSPVVVPTAAQPEEKPSTSSILDPKDPKSIIYLNTKGELAGTGDPNKSGSPSEAYRIGSGWHPAALAGAGLPKDKYGLVNWAKIVKDNLLTPRHSLDPSDAEDMPPLDMNILIETKSDFVNNVIYPHYIHTWWLKCEICHPKIFIPQKGANRMFMTEIAQGQWCGRCHGKVSFPLTDCTRCHVSPKKAAATPEKK